MYTLKWLDGWLGNDGLHFMARDAFLLLAGKLARAGGGSELPYGKNNRQKYPV